MRIRVALKRFATLIALLVVTSCTAMQLAAGGRPPGALQSHAHVHGLQMAATSFSLMNGHHYGWPTQLGVMRTDGIALLQALRDKGYGVEIQVLPRQQGKDEVYDVNLRFPKRGAKATIDAKPTKKGAKATSPAEPEPAPVPTTLVPPIAPPGIDQVLVQKGYVAISSIANFMVQLNVSNQILQDHAFALLVLKEKIKAGEKADWADATRPAAESIEDIDLALRLIAAHHAEIQVFRAHVLTMMALTAAIEAPNGIDELRHQLDEDQAWSTQWPQTHKQPTVEDFGVRMQALPAPDAFIGKLDVDVGLLAAVIKTAQGVAAGSPQMTLDGLAALAPQDSTVGTVLSGLSAAGHGDIKGVIACAGKLTGTEAQINDIEARLARVNDSLKTVRTPNKML